jgi:hypothetical protein
MTKPPARVPFPLSPFHAHWQCCWLLCSPWPADVLKVPLLHQQQKLLTGAASLAAQQLQGYRGLFGRADTVSAMTVSTTQCCCFRHDAASTKVTCFAHCSSVVSEDGSAALYDVRHLSGAVPKESCCNPCAFQNLPTVPCLVDVC